MSELVHKTDTLAENELQNLISSMRPRVWARYNERIPVESEERPDAAYFPDVIVDDFLILEAEGKVSASVDNQRRDEELRRQGKRVIHLSNRTVHDQSNRIAIVQFISLIIELHSALLLKERQSVK